MDAERTRQTRTAYSTVAASYDRLVCDTSFEAVVDLAMIEFFLAQLGVGRGADVLDAGCGAGRMLTHLEQLDSSLHLTGIDLAPGMVDRARANHPTRRIEQADLVALPFSEAQFDGVLSWYSIIHTPGSDLFAIAAELRRVLRPAGYLLLGFHAGGGERAARHAYGHDVDLRVVLHDVGLVTNVLTTAGFEVVAQLERAARPVEKDAQGFLLATRT